MKSLLNQDQRLRLMAIYLGKAEIKCWTDRTAVLCRAGQVAKAVPLVLYWRPADRDEESARDAAIDWKMRIAAAGWSVEVKPEPDDDGKGPPETRARTPGRIPPAP